MSTNSSTLHASSTRLQRSRSCELSLSIVLYTIGSIAVNAFYNSDVGSLATAMQPLTILSQGTAAYPPTSPMPLSSMPDALQIPPLRDFQPGLNPLIINVDTCDDVSKLQTALGQYSQGLQTHEVVKSLAKAYSQCWVEIHKYRPHQGNEMPPAPKEMAVRMRAVTHAYRNQVCVIHHRILPKIFGYDLENVLPEFRIEGLEHLACEIEQCSGAAAQRQLQIFEEERGPENIGLYSVFKRCTEDIVSLLRAEMKLIEARLSHLADRSARGD